ncbi:MAG: alkaline phosphatase [Myxococcota bacterium]
MRAWLVALTLAGCVIPRAYRGGEARTIPDDRWERRLTIPAEAPRTRHVILMVGDGMGMGALTSALVANRGRLSLDRLGVVGLQQTWSADELVTDGAAAATAIACGVKTDNGAIGLTVNGQPVPSLLQWAEQHGWATGLVATSRITHATPAAFVAHHPDHDEEYEIALDFLDMDIDVVIGGGRDRFIGRRDKRDLLFELQERYGVTIVDSVRDVARADLGKPVYALTTDGPWPQASKSDPAQLAEATELALERLSRLDQPFFLVVEGSQIDWGAQWNHTPRIVSEMLAFDRAVGRAVDFATEHPDALVVVTAGHETGGIAIKDGNRITGEVTARFTTHGHTATLVPVLATGAGSERFAGIYDNTELHDRLLAAMTNAVTPNHRGVRPAMGN